MVLLGFAWFLSALNFSVLAARLLVGVRASGGLWGGVFLHLIMGFPSGRLGPGRRPRAGDRGLPDLHRGLDSRHVVRRSARSGLRRLPVQRAVDPSRLGSRARGDRLAGRALPRALRDGARPPDFLRWRRTNQLERLQLTPVYVCGLLTFLLATAAHGGRGRRCGLGRVQRHRAAAVRLPGRVVAQPRCTPGRRPARPASSCAPPAPASSRPATPSAGGWSATCTTGPATPRGPGLLPATRAGAGRGPRRPRACSNARPRAAGGLAELRELARGIHPAVLSERGLEPALQALASRAPLPVDGRTDGRSACPPRSRRPRTSWSPRRWPTSRSTPGTQASVAVGGPTDRRSSNQRRRHRRRRRRPGHRPARPRRPRRGTRRHALARQPAGPRHAPARRDPLRVARRVRRSGPGHPLGQVMRAASRQRSSVRLPYANSATRARMTATASAGEGRSRPLSTALTALSPNRLSGRPCFS